MQQGGHTLQQIGHMMQQGGHTTTQKVFPSVLLNVKKVLHIFNRLGSLKNQGIGHARSRLTVGRTYERFFARM